MSNIRNSRRIAIYGILLASVIIVIGSMQKIFSQGTDGNALLIAGLFLSVPAWVLLVFSLRKKQQVE